MQSLQIESRRQHLFFCLIWESISQDQLRGRFIEATTTALLAHFNKPKECEFVFQKTNHNLAFMMKMSVSAHVLPQAS